MASVTCARRIFQGIKFLIMVFLGSSGKFCTEMKFWYF